MVSFKELKVGDKGEVKKTITEQDVLKFAEISLDTNPIHLDEDFASKTMFKGKIIHGMLTASLISAAVGTKMPGPGSIWMSQTLKWLKPVHIGDTITAVSELIEKIEEKKHVIVKTTCLNQNNEIVAEGQGKHKILNP
ncbi:MAG: MaoC family dehydratase [archaeon]|nr:MaoC family dehydratase [archaeon]